MDIVMINGRPFVGSFATGYKPVNGCKPSHGSSVKNHQHSGGTHNLLFPANVEESRQTGQGNESPTAFQFANVA